MKCGKLERVALITGASAGIGRAIAEELLQAGAKVVVNARREGALDEIALCWNKEDLKVIKVVGDASDDNVIAQCFAQSTEHFARTPDIVVVNAGRGLGGSLLSVDLGKFQEILELNILAAAKLMQRAANELIKEPWDAKASPRDIVVLGSVSGHNISPFSSVYGSTKFAISALAEGLRREVGPKGVRVTLLEPGIVLSEFQDGAGYSKDWHKMAEEKYAPMLLPEDIARLTSFIVSQPPHVHLSNVIIRPTRQDYP